ncbi:RagB/SusD family nutrient uptake outer membrane protein [Chitinophaga horti]|uniref:RagB/SusD family nutrient uptake outer membrane protein n=1 Tax=Chitinophaga horti TaxID=2920382 RepID=A0ABY6IZ29_9BACT|nr:RagB/SusD family nutrient uptake outer membrane protein [Chitinophaga horti]UYQ92630.1 RagB/SusD family nutrient uptake outer membrane protein [Chitinophaga horti]
MKINKLINIKNACLLAGAMVAMNGCKIDITPPDRYTEGTIFANPANMEQYIFGMYSEFKTFAFGEFPIGYSGNTDGLTDLLKYTSMVSGNGTINVLATDASRVNAASPHLNYWGTGYTRIRRLNEFIHGLYNYAKVDEATRNRYEAEARFIRGYVYFWLVKLHGSVILLDNLDQYSVYRRERSSEEDCYKFIANDFAFAAANLPKEWTSAGTGRATKGAAFGMLARTWLYAASIAEYDRKQFNDDPLTGIPAANAQTYYTNAAQASDSVIQLANEGYYRLENNYADAFTNKNTKEALFKLDFVSPNVTHNYDLGFAPKGDYPDATLVYGVPTAELVDEYEMADGSDFSWGDNVKAANPYANREPRFYASILYNGAAWKGRTINTTPGSVEGWIQYGSTTEPKTTVTGYYARKMLTQTATNFPQVKSTQSWSEMRYAEVLLINAEAKTKINKLEEARTSLLAVRDRVDLPVTNAVTPEQMMIAIEHERIVELAFEGHRYWDLRRWRKAHIVLNDVKFHGHKVTPNGATFKYEVVDADDTNREFTPSLYYMPIITSELQANLGLSQIKPW